MLNGITIIFKSVDNEIRLFISLHWYKRLYCILGIIIAIKYKNNAIKKNDITNQMVMINMKKFSE